MGFAEWFGVVGGVISIIAFMFSVWVWLKADIKVRELRGIVATTHDISGSIMWEMSKAPGEDAAAQLRRAERSLGSVSAIHTLTAKYVDSATSFRRTDFEALLERGVVRTTAMVWDVEQSDRTREIWLVTPDLEPDLSDPEVRVLVRRNVRAGKRYTYFFPKDIGNAAEIESKLLGGLDLTKSPKLARSITVIATEPTSSNGLLHRGNSILFFDGDPASATMYAFEEVVFTRITERGIFWQELPKALAEELRRALQAELTRSIRGSGSSIESADASTKDPMH
jgi:hypothetical protein